MTRIPVILFGDGPRLPTGLGRIARDLAARIVAHADAWDIQFAQVGITEPGGWHWDAWPVYGFQPTRQDYGRSALIQACRDLEAETGQPPIVFTVQDPARVYDLTRRDPDWRVRSTFPRVELILATFWSYFAVDAHNPRGMLGGPAAQAVRDVHRVLAYGQWGATILSKTIGGELLPPIDYLPHGIDTDVFHPQASIPVPDDTGFWAWVEGQAPDTLLIGCVAANQPRKDFGLLFATVAEIQARGRTVSLWLHTDLLTGMAWDVGELTRQFGLQKRQVYVSTGEISDAALAGRYGRSDVTLAPGLGEGFGYPIVESLACGTPVVHGNYGGGVELIPTPAWLVEPVAWRVESVYALVRPVFNARDWADTVLQTQTSRNPPEWYAQHVRHLEWRSLWPFWQQWFETGLTAYRRGLR